MRCLDVHVLKFAEVHLLVASLSRQMLISGLLILNEAVDGFALDNLQLFFSTTVAGFTTVLVPTDDRFGSFLPRDLYRREVASDFLA